jgi:hypothetical protein
MHYVDVDANGNFTNSDTFEDTNPQETWNFVIKNVNTYLSLGTPRSVAVVCCEASA